MADGANGITNVRNPVLKRLVEACAEAWRERRSERRAIAAPKGGPDPRVARSRIGAALEARLAVRSGVRLDDFLRQRLAKYAGALPVPLESLPITVDVEGGEAVIRPRRPARTSPPSHRDPASAGPGRGEREDPRTAREIRETQAALDRLDERAAAARARLEAIEQDLAQAYASGELASWPDLDASAEQLGRPPIPSPAPFRALRGFVTALLAAEAWRFAAPVLASSGITPDGIEAALRATPVPAALGLLFALGAAAAVFAFAGVALARGAEAVAAAGPRKGLLLGGTAAGAALLAGAVATAASAPDRWAHLALLVAIPFAGGLLWRVAGRLDANRSAAVQAALAWDRERTREAVERGRREGARDRAAAELRGLEAERAAARRKVQQLERLAIAVERAADLAARAEARRLDRLAEGLAAALELDRYLYIRLAADRSISSLDRGARTARREPSVAAERLGVAR